MAPGNKVTEKTALAAGLSPLSYAYFYSQVFNAPVAQDLALLETCGTRLLAIPEGEKGKGKRESGNPLPRPLAPLPDMARMKGSG